MHRGVSGGNNNDSELQVDLEFPAEFYEHGTVKGAPVKERGRPVFNSSAVV